MDRPKGSSSSSNGTSSHRASILSRSRTSKKITTAATAGNSNSTLTSLKRSKSLHCPKATRFTAAASSFNSLMNNSGGGDARSHYQPQCHPLLRSSELPMQLPYGSRRHHSTNDYEQMMMLYQKPEVANNGSQNLVLNSSSHSLYRLYNSPSATSVGVSSSPKSHYPNHHHPHNHQLYHPRASCASSGASLASLGSENPLQQHQQNLYSTSLNGSRKASECFYEDVFTMAEPSSSSSADLRHLSQQMNSLALFGSQDHTSLQAATTTQDGDPLSTNGSNSTITNNGVTTTPMAAASRRYNGSSSSSSLINGQPDYSSLLADNQFDQDDQDDQSSFWGADNDNYFNLEPLPVANGTEAPLSKSTSNIGARSTVAKKSNSKASGLPPFRFYLVRQRNYPPLFLENGGSRRRIYRTLVLGYPSSGKSSLLEQFAGWLAEAEAARSFHPAMAADLADPSNLLVHFLESDSFDKYLLQVPVIDYQPDAYLILFSVNNRDSFNSVKKTLVDLQRWDDVETKAVIIVANKSDLVRGRCVTRREGRELASANNCKYIEVSCTISHNIDVLLQGLGSQMVLKEEQQRKQKELEQTKLAKSQNHSPLKRRDSLLKRFLRKTALNKSKSCDNLHVL